MDHYLELLKLILPKFLVDYFDLVKTEKKNEVMHLYSEEQNVISV